MRSSMGSLLLLALTGAASAASLWGFSDASVTVSRKDGDSVVEKIEGAEGLRDALVLGHQDKLKVVLTAKDGSKAKRPHQAFLVVKESTGLEVPFPFSLKPSGKGTVEITQKDLPVQHLLSTSPLQVRVMLGTFGPSQPSESHLFDVRLELDPSVSSPSYEAPLRYGKLAEIHHIFRPDPTNPPKIVSAVFALAVLAMVPSLFVGWILLGGNLNHATQALGSAPISHALFFGSITAMEGVFFLYYTSWNLFQTLPVLGLVGVVAFLSGTKALSEVQRRRLAGER